MDFYVYQYVDPLTLLPFYIGKGRGNRINIHLSETKSNTENFKKYCFIKGLRNKGLEPIVEKVFENLSENDAYLLESELIRKYGRIGIDDSGILTNICENNQPPKPIWTEERKLKTSKKLMGNTNGHKWKNKPYPQELKDKISKKLKENHPTKGKSLYSFFERKYGDNALAKWNEMIEKRSKNRIGHLHTEESKIKMKTSQKEANKGRIWIHKKDESSIQTRFIKSEELSSFESNGWYKGRK